MSTRTIDRRQALIRLGVGAAGLLTLPRGLRAQDLSAQGRGAQGLSGQGSSAGPPPKLDDLEGLAERVRGASREGVFDVAVQAIRAGAGYGDLLGAAFMAGIHDVRPRSVGGKLHCVMMVDSAFQLTEQAPAREAWLAALWSLDDFKRSQERDRQEEGDWVLPAPPRVSFPSSEAARRELVAAMEAWDAERADRGVVGLLSQAGGEFEPVFEVLWPFAARCFVDIGHKIIFCVQVERALRRLGRQYAEPALRSVVNGLLYRSDSISPSELAVFARAGELARKLPADWRAGKEEPGKSEELLRQLRECDPRQAQELVVTAFQDGLGPQTVWDGIRLYASELLHRRPKSAARRHGPVHGVTEVNAFAYVERTTRNETTRRLMVLQAAGWMPLMRRSLGGFFGAQQGPGLDVLGGQMSENLPTLEEVFEQPSPDAARARIDQQPGGAGAFIAQLRGHLVERAFQSHQYKYAAAIQEESALAHPRWASRILAPAVTYVPVPGDPETEAYERSLRTLRQAGVM